MTTVTLARNAMASRFELVLHGQSAARLQAAGEEALREIEAIEARLSLFEPSSEIAHANSRAAREPVALSAPVFTLLRSACLLSRQTGGAFDFTVGPLVRAWGFWSGEPRRPDPVEIQELRSRTGVEHIELNEANLTVRFHKPGMMIDLGAIGKGYAVEQAIEILREDGVESAFLHGGTSTLYALGSPPDQPGWKVALELPQEQSQPGEAKTQPDAMHRLFSASSPLDSRRPQGILAELELRDQALSVSSPRGRWFEADGVSYGHVIDPRTGTPTRGARLAAVALPSATETDALSTALLVLGPEGVPVLEGIRPGIRLWVRT